MKITALNVAPIARIFASIYGVIGLVSWIALRLTHAKYVILPIGIIGPLLHLNFSVSFRQSEDVFTNVFFMFASVASYAVTGAITAVAGVLCFNAVAKRKGGISADFVLFSEESEPGSSNINESGKVNR